MLDIFQRKNYRFNWRPRLLCHIRGRPCSFEHVFIKVTLLEIISRICSFHLSNFDQILSRFEQMIGITEEYQCNIFLPFDNETTIRNLFHNCSVFARNLQFSNFYNWWANYSMRKSFVEKKFIFFFQIDGIFSADSVALIIIMHESFMRFCKTWLFIGLIHSMVVHGSWHDSWMAIHEKSTWLNLQKRCLLSFWLLVKEFINSYCH